MMILYKYEQNITKRLKKILFLIVSGLSKEKVWGYKKGFYNEKKRVCIT